jgi:ribosomal protein S18 acetylase RimI-like enzyme
VIEVEARLASSDDLDDLLTLYEGLTAEMEALHPMWPLADGLPEPVSESMALALKDPDTVVVLGTIDEVPLGFLLVRIEDLLPQADGMQVGAIRFVFVDHPAREVGVGEAMLALALSRLRERGLHRFDAHVLPGHRLVKNFFEAGGFAARSITMHHVD